MGTLMLPFELTNNAGMWSNRITQFDINANVTHSAGDLATLFEKRELSI